MPIPAVIISSLPDAIPNPIKIAAPEYKGVTVDTRYTPINNLLVFVEGSSWEVAYFSQVLNSNNGLSGQQVTQDPVYQQYTLINELELKVTGPLNSNQDTTSGSMQTTGTATMYPFIIPNVGDMFLADIGDGREGVFRVTESTRKSILKETCYEVEYLLIEVATVNRVGDLRSKVIKTLQFVKDFLMHGQNPLVKDSDYEILKKLSNNYHDILDSYFKSFTSNEFKTLLVPGQTQVTYDHYLVKAVKAFFNTEDAPEIKSIRTLNCDEDEVLKATTIWDVIKNRDPKLLKHAVKHIGLVSNKTFHRNPVMDGIYFSGVREIVYPKDSELSVDYNPIHLRKVLSPGALIDSPSPITRLEDLLAITELNNQFNDGKLPIISVTNDDFYIFSQSFYENDTVHQSRLEVAVLDYLNKRTIRSDHLLALCETHHAWGGLERFYYIPILLVLIKAAARGY